MDAEDVRASKRQLAPNICQPDINNCCHVKVLLCSFIYKSNDAYAGLKKLKF